MIFRLGIESYQEKINLTKPKKSLSGIKKHHLYSLHTIPKCGGVYLDKPTEKKFLRLCEVENYSDGKLTMILFNLHTRKHKDKYGPEKNLLPQQTRILLDNAFHKLNDILVSINVIQRLEMYVGDREKLSGIGVKTTY